MSKRILVVEDQEDLRGVLMIEAGDGPDGVATALSERPDPILMGIQLPLLDGYEATRQTPISPSAPSP